MFEFEGKLYDKRVVGRYIEKGLVKEKEYQDRLKNLPDDEKNGTWVKLDIQDTELAEEN